jgi:hypothetical protein
MTPSGMTEREEQKAAPRDPPAVAAPPIPGSAREREARLARALRANLRRRKAGAKDA